MQLRLFSWNVNGIRAAYKKGFLEWLDQASPDVLCLQETKASLDQLEPALCNPAGYHTYWASATRKGYSGVALYSKREPLSVELGLGIPDYDDEGRTIVADYGDFVLLTAYFPNGGRDLARVPFKMAYKEAFLSYINTLRAAGRPVIFCGDVNTAHCEIDLANPKGNVKHTGFLPEERAWIDKIVEQGYVDVYRNLYPDQTGAYTWWPFWGGARDRNVGWRIDYFFTTPDLQDRIVGAAIHDDVPGSDHCPISMTIEVEGQGMA